MEQERKEEIGWEVFKVFCREEGILRGNNLKKMAGNMEQAIKESKEKIIYVYFMAFEELFQKVFSKKLLLSPKTLEVYGIFSDIVSEFSLQERNRIAWKIIVEEIKKVPIRLEKSKIFKEVAELENGTKISQEEIKVFLEDIIENYFSKTRLG
ncbi:MAG: hypothetical protein PHW33_02150 [Candidatus Portnoybacteria bacterium]|nr:hypothetical protein [Candidatus Portnoybacteria bacterium]